MNDLIVPVRFQDAFPTIAQGLKKAMDLFSAIRSFKDVERYLLKGAGLAQNTYKTYLSAVKGFYEYTGGKHPLQITPGDIEAWYDDLLKTVDRNSACIKVYGLKRFFAGIQENVLKIYTSPFELMSEKLLKKLGRSKKPKRGKALNIAEVNRLLDMLDYDESTIGLENKAMIKLMLGTGLRAAELCNLKWQDVEFDEDESKYYVSGVGKGDKPFTQEVAIPEAIADVERYFRKHFHRKPRPEDYLFYTVSSHKGNGNKQMNNTVLFLRMRKVGEKARAKGVTTRNISWSPHLMRRTCGTILDKLKMSPVSIQRFLRHSSLQTTAQFYIVDSEPAGPYFEKAFAGST
ncbi:Tyrosine recombinase XerC [subsurface metagenome]